MISARGLTQFALKLTDTRVVECSSVLHLDCDTISVGADLSAFPAADASRPFPAAFHPAVAAHLLSNGREGGQEEEEARPPYACDEPGQADR